MPTTTDTEAPKRATARQWKTMAGLSKDVGARSATHLCSLVLDRPERELRELGVLSREASRVISTALNLIESQ